MPSKDITLLIQEMQDGKAKAVEKLFPLVYEEMRRLAGQKMKQEAANHTLQATALVHEAYIRLVGDQGEKWDGRNHFYAAAAEAMRRILIESARRKAALKHGEGINRVEITIEPAVENDADFTELLSLDEALTKLESVDAEAFQVVKLRFYGGLTVEEAAVALGISERTTQRHWNYAKAWLKRELQENS